MPSEFFDQEAHIGQHGYCQHNETECAEQGAVLFLLFGRKLIGIVDIVLHSCYCKEIVGEK